MKTRIYTPEEGKPPRKFRYISGDCLEGAGLKIPHGGYAIIDCSISPKAGDLVHCNNELGTVNGFIKQVKEFRDDTVIVGTSYIDQSRDFTFEAFEIYGVVTEVFCKLWGKQVYLRGSEKTKKTERCHCVRTATEIQILIFPLSMIAAALTLEK